jgi:hypothetical protein
MPQITHKVKIDGKMDQGFQNSQCSVKFEYDFFRKYLEDFSFKNMFKINMALAFDVTSGIFFIWPFSGRILHTKSNYTKKSHIFKV